MAPLGHDVIFSKTMPDHEFHFEVTNEYVYVRRNVSGKTRFLALAFFSGIMIIFMCLLLIMPGKHGAPSMWHSMSTAAFGSFGFLFPFFLLLCFPLLILVGTKRYVRLAYPSDESFRCDQSTLCIARVRWFDIHNEHWESSSFALSDVQEIKYKAIASLRGMTIYGLRLKAGGKTLRILPELKPVDAERILLALKALGADVPDDPVVSSKLKNDLSLQ
jgi:hypothetical protein